MAHWAEIDNNNIVLRVVVGDNDDPNNDEGHQWLVDILGGTWIQTSYNNNFRGTFAGIGFYYDAVRDVFIPPKFNCHEEEIYNEEHNGWVCSNESHPRPE